MGKVSTYLLLLIALGLSVSSCIVTKKSSSFYETVKHTDNLHFDKTEVDVGSWLSFYTWVLNNDGYAAAQEVLPDSNAIDQEVWRCIRQGTAKSINQLGRYSFQRIGSFNPKCTVSQGSDSFFNQPITGVSYEQVIRFCEWRTAVQGHGKVVYRLPTLDEWVNFALGGLSELELQAGFRDSLHTNGCPMYNYCTPPIDIDKQINRATYNFSYPPNGLGAFEVFGNVSEMTSVKGIAKGGNYTLFASQCHPDSTQRYSKPQAWLGFRCVAEKKSGVASQNAPAVLSPTIDSKVLLEKEDADSLTEVSDNYKFGTFTDPRDGRKYRTVRIGSQVWMAQNLAYKPNEGKFWAYKNNEENVAIYGYLYSWETAQDVCPTGWYLPSKEEFDFFLLYFKETDIKQIYYDLISTGNSGFSVISLGSRLGPNNFTPNENGAAMWTSTEASKRMAWAFDVGDIKLIVELRDNFRKKIGLPVRCLRNQ